MTDPTWAVSVVIPAQDESGWIGACIRSVLDAALVAGHPVDITVVADRCTDDTVGEAARALGGQGRIVEIDVGSVGTGRRIGVARSLLVLEAAGHRPARSWLLATDADSVVPSDWIASHLRHADAGVHGVAGIVVVDSFADHPPSVEPAFHRRYEIGRGGQHAHVHGTNLGVRADAYHRAGGWHDVDTGEDHDLWNRLERTGATLVSTVEAPVRTSGRGQGRAPDGFASLLRSLVSEEPDDIAR